MRHRITIFAVAAALALSLGLGAPAQALPNGNHGVRPAAGWWQATVNTLATLFGLDRPAASPKVPKRDGSPCIDPNGNPVCPAPQPAVQVDGSCGIDPAGNPVCHPGS